MLFRKLSFDAYWDRIMDACEDTAVGRPLKESPQTYKDDYAKAVNNRYVDFAKWLYETNFNLDKEIEFFNNKYLDGYDSREASHQVLTYKYWKWRSSIYEV